MENRFKIAFRGFDRQDVQDYIVRTDAAHRARTQELETDLADARKELEELRRELSELKGEHGSVAAEEARVRASLEESTATLTRVRGELNETEDQLAAARAELDRLQEQVTEMEPAARNYQELKERIAEIELESHKRAQAIENDANVKALATRQRTRKWLRGVLGEYQKLCDAADKLDEQLREVEGLTGVLLSGDNAAVKLMEELGG